MHSYLILLGIMEGIRIKERKKKVRDKIQISMLYNLNTCLKTSLLWIYAVTYYLQNHKPNPNPLTKIILYACYIKIT